MTDLGETLAKDKELERAVEVAEYAAESQPTPEQEKKVLRKIDCLLIPLMCGCVLCKLFMSLTNSVQMLDKILLNSAVLLNIKTETHLNSSWKFTWINSIFYFGYLAGTPIHVYFLQHVPLSYYVSGIVTFWGVIVALHAACHDYGGLLTIRFFLGLFEAAVTPGLILMTGRFYTRKEQTVRTVVWFSFNGWAFIFGGIITYGILRQGEPAHIKKWQELYIILGVLTICWGLLCFFVMPTSPDTTRYLSKEQRGIAVYRIARNQSGIHNTTFKWSQAKEALRDIRLYMFFFGYACICVTNGGITSYSSQIIKEFNFSNENASLLGMAQGLAEVVAVLMGGAIFAKCNRRDIPSMIGLTIAVVGSIMMVALGPSQNSSRMAGLCLVSFFSIPLPMFYNWQSVSVSGTTKRVIFNAVLQLAYGAGNIVGPITYSVSANPKTPMIAMIILFAVNGGFIIGISGIHRYWNAKRDAEMMRVKPDQETDHLEVDLSDLTDKERPTFRYPR
ncbi:hypothetical protein MYAM1_002765 [Malassezia yamatoensis]|uniref:MFS general substrate transporter n=1 Tax=Malassezia yamatoensis TaxID=253288 RepID=A0AAJ6CIN3_9BASI|nr:hypothetical protein MYAM1_002765 [Malassezia yamatoensis]